MREPRDVDVLGLVDLLLVDFDVAECSLEEGTPRHQPSGTVCQTGIEHADKGFLDGLGQHVVHCEGFPRPVDRRADSPQLIADGVALLLLPLPHFVDERLTAVIVPRLALGLCQLPLHDSLCGDAGVVGPRHPQRHIATHTVPSGEGVFDGRGECVADVQVARHVGRGDHHDELLTVLGVEGRLGVRREVPLLLPPVAPCALDHRGVVPTLHRMGQIFLGAFGCGVDERLFDLLCRTAGFALSGVAFVFARCFLGALVLLLLLALANSRSTTCAIGAFNHRGRSTVVRCLLVLDCSCQLIAVSHPAGTLEQGCVVRVREMSEDLWQRHAHTPIDKRTCSCSKAIHDYAIRR
mmetsp:Transcript_13056/g.31188  ORF Transcript_13056/g.31188 Transcript_13056/m.31188 type:complete len:351 (-) Transcript_13056:574-1626(-)